MVGKTLPLVLRGHAPPPLVVTLGEEPEPQEPLPAPFMATLTHRQLRGRPFTGQLRSELFLCTDHKTLRITERITRLLCPSSGPGPRHPPQQVRKQSPYHQWLSGVVSPEHGQPVCWRWTLLPGAGAPGCREAGPDPSRRGNFPVSGTGRISPPTGGTSLFNSMHAFSARGTFPVPRYRKGKSTAESKLPDQICSRWVFPTGGCRIPPWVST